MRVLILGGGPVGLSAALLASARGHDVTLLEKDEVGASLLRWGPVRLFTPLGMNLPVGAAALAGVTLPPDDALLTGPEMVRDVLRPIATGPRLAGRILAGHRVLAVGRAGMTRGERAGHPLRGERPLRLLAQTPDGERLMEAEAVLDATGVYGTPTAAGVGGLPAPGERALGDRVIRHLGTLAEHAAALAGRRILLVGNGHSAANAILMLESIAGEAPATRVTWLVRCAHGRPCEEVADDPLPERRRVAGRANDLAQAPPAWLQVVRRGGLASLAPEGESIAAAFTSGGGGAFDAIVSMTGYRPDLSFLSELALDISPATEGSGRLARALGGATDCLRVPAVRPEDLASGEPGFHLIGAKSYGRARTFLMQTGLSQLETLLDGLHR